MRKMNAHDPSSILGALGVIEHRSAATDSTLLPFLIDKYIAEGRNVAGQC
jgi:hypothetical protein